MEFLDKFLANVRKANDVYKLEPDSEAVSQTAAAAGKDEEHKASSTT